MNRRLHLPFIASYFLLIKVHKLYRYNTRVFVFSNTYVCVRAKLPLIFHPTKLSRRCKCVNRNSLTLKWLYIFEYVLCFNGCFLIIIHKTYWLLSKRCLRKSCCEMFWIFTYLQPRFTTSGPPYCLGENFERSICYIHSQLNTAYIIVFLLFSYDIGIK